MPLPDSDALLPKPSNSGIIQKFDSAERIIPASRRPDGSLRPERKIRPGYVPVEDIARYRTVQQRQRDAAQGLAATPVASPPRPFSAKGASIPGLPTRPQVQVTKAASAAAAAASDSVSKPRKGTQRKEEKKPEIPDSWDDEGTDKINGPEKKLEVSGEGTADEKPSVKEPEAERKKDQPRPSPEQEPESKAATEKETASEEETRQEPDTQESLQKKSRALQKKLRQAEVLRKRKNAGDLLLHEQNIKVNGMDELEKDLEDIESRLSSLKV